ncbi:2-C-methyl-D-erythritol 4-phosphate cytidylyltransferase [Desulfovibrio sp. OttesenSCG-928-F07]|nr:2-C-methyl-D-erythritol 4-phosphate cytidylyltransferase [Desulfovibrio sp. OttesenSCG-928-F07]
MNKQTWAILLAAGQGKRLKQAPSDPSKQFIEYKNVPLFWHSARTFTSVAAIKGIVFVFSEAEMSYAAPLLAQLLKNEPLGLPHLVVTGGIERQDSVWNGLAALPPECTKVLVHDSARPFVSGALVNNIINCVQNGSIGVVPGLEPADTIKIINAESTVQSTPQRSLLRSVQTPQGFDKLTLLNAHIKCRENSVQVTDDASMLEYCGLPVQIIPGEAGNCKITRPEDLEMLQENKNIQMVPCTGVGYDVHKYGGNRPFKLGGVIIDSTDIMVQAHSDGDVLLHALMDALLGCAALGDIGQHFPDTDGKFDNISSSVLLAEVMELVRSKDIMLTHVDMTVIAQAPKIAPFKREIVKNVAHLLHMPEEHVNLKGTTEEGLGFTGAKQGIKALVSVTGLRKF